MESVLRGAAIYFILLVVLRLSGRRTTAQTTPFDLVLLLIVVVAGFTTGKVAFTKMIGVGMIVAIVVDATLVRALLVPASMRLLGLWNWWAPGPLARVYRRYGIREAAESTPEPPAAGPAHQPDGPRRSPQLVGTPQV